MCWLVFLLLTLTLPATAQEVGELAPDFALVDRAGDRVALSDFAGTPVVLNFWATWCLPCLEELPVFQRAGEDLGNEIAFLLVNNSEAADTAAVYLQEQDITLPVGLEPTRRQRAELDLDRTAAVLRRYAVFGIPTTVFIGAEGAVQSVNPGPLRAAELAEQLQTLGVNWTP